MDSQLILKSCKFVGSKISIIAEMPNSLAGRGKPIQIRLIGKELSASVEGLGTCKIAMPQLGYSVQDLANPAILSFANGNLGLGYLLDKGSIDLAGKSSFERVISNYRAISYEDFLKDCFEGYQTKEESMNSQNPQSFMGNSVDMFPPDANGRWLFNYYLYDMQSDDVLDMGAVIVKGNTKDEAAVELREKIKAKVQGKQGPGIKLHIVPVLRFEKPKAEEDPYKAAIDALKKVMP